MEARVIKATMDKDRSPVTMKELVTKFKSLGISGDKVIIVHSSLSSLGFVCGGATSVILALIHALQIPMPDLQMLSPPLYRNQGTLVMPSFSSDYSNPKYWENPAVPNSWLDVIEKEWPPFHPAITPTRGIGQIPELFRTFPGVLRSNHPTCSFTAIGKHAKHIVSDHSLNSELGMESPLGKVYSLNGYVLLIGVGNDVNTSLHLAEYIYHIKEKTFDDNTIVQRSPIMLHRCTRKNVSYDVLKVETDQFEDIGKEFLEFCSMNHPEWYKETTIGLATVSFIYQPALVDFAVKRFGASN